MRGIKIIEEIGAGASEAAPTLARAVAAFPDDYSVACGAADALASIGEAASIVINDIKKIRPKRPCVKSALKAIRKPKR